MRRHRKPRVLVDVDEVLIDFHGHAFDVIEQVTGVRHTLAEMKEWDMFKLVPEKHWQDVLEILRRPGVALSLKPYPDAVRGLSLLQERAEVHLVTSPFLGSATWASERMQSVMDHFGFDSEQITITRAKHVVYGDALIDDKPLNIVNWYDYHPGGLPMLWHLSDAIGKEQDHLRVRSWDEAVARLDRYLAVQRIPSFCTRCHS